ncbi:MULTISPECIES: hypothetical protein [Streptomyces violaceusniger group]|nr:hypothetical protein [Streptomyces rhizosphaericus]
MNAIAERWIRTCRREATGRIVITGQKHLRHPQGTRTLSTWGQRSPSGLISADPQYRSILEGFAESVSSADFQAGELVLSGDECR